MTFPASPSVGDTHQLASSGPTYTFTSDNIWARQVGEGGSGFFGQHFSEHLSPSTNSTVYGNTFTLIPGGFCFIQTYGINEGSVAVNAEGIGDVGYAYINTTASNVTVKGRATNGGTGAFKGAIFYAFNPS